MVFDIVQWITNIFAFFKNSSDRGQKLMCLLAVYFRVAEDAPLIIGANREELYSRGGEPPRKHHGSPWYVAGVDPKAGGTWLGVNQHGLAAAITNRPKSQVPQNPRSRGLLVQELLHCSNAAAAEKAAIREIESGHYAGCNLLIGDSDRLVVIHSGEWLRVRPLPPGLHVMTSHDVNDASDLRLAHAIHWLEQCYPQTAEDCLNSLQKLCSQYGREVPPICLHGPVGGTVSSTLLAIRKPIYQSILRHAQGSPDQTPYSDFSALF